MKKCPTCDKTFEDSMRFCQVDGTELVSDAPPFDPYATIVAPTISAEPPAPVIETPAPEFVLPPDEVEVDPSVHYTVGSIPITEPEDVLDLPSNDPLKTMYVSEAEMKATLGDAEPAADIVEIPPIEEVSEPAPPSFIAPENPALVFEPPAPPPSPFSMESVPAAPAYEEPEPPPPVFEEPVYTSPFLQAPAVEDPGLTPFQEAATMIQPGFSSQFETPPAAPVAEWTPPPAPEPSWQNQQIGSNTPFQPPPAGAAGENKTLAIVSLVLGILGVTICCGALIPSIAALITGFMARGKAASDPDQYGGAGLALGGMITGGLGLVLGIVVIILQVFFGVMGNLAR